MKGFRERAFGGSNSCICVETWPDSAMYALKRRLICGSFLLLVILGSLVDLDGEHSGRAKLGPSLLGLASGLLLGVIHIPEAGIFRFSMSFRPFQAF